jgi:hypothetical protein
MTTNTELVDTYFDRAVQPDVNAYVALFAATAVVEDDGHQYRGVDAIRTWRSGTVAVHYEVLNTVVGDDGTTARVRISGEFAGSPVVLLFRFGFDGDGRIVSLAIRPE